MDFLAFTSSRAGIQTVHFLGEHPHIVALAGLRRTRRIHRNPGRSTPRPKQASDNRRTPHYNPEYRSDSSTQGLEAALSGRPCVFFAGQSWLCSACGRLCFGTLHRREPGVRLVHMSRVRPPVLGRLLKARDAREFRKAVQAQGLPVGENIALWGGLVNIDGAWVTSGVAAWLLGAGPRLHPNLSRSPHGVLAWPGKLAFALARLECCTR
ncbi:hypothetical protein FA13DRAFT_1331041 [Coprinellus micaceus]|uniref:Uncharacterized protein n=1 Tax=Coprinellus micaceus TaxID=71717 RepID=A0A4Y7R5R6_COPMI|nr:hypothetical protein FA13DRAFT_1331041 [Coprinellus micaceus]